MSYVRVLCECLKQHAVQLNRHMFFVKNSFVYSKKSILRKISNATIYYVFLYVPFYLLFSLIAQGNALLLLKMRFNENVTIKTPSQNIVNVKMFGKVYSKDTQSSFWFTRWVSVIMLLIYTITM